MRFEKRYELARETIINLGKELKVKHHQKLDVSFKDKNRDDPVTELDRYAQNTIINAVKGRFKEDRFLGEEEGEEKSVIDSKSLWVIDPIDGTANFMHGLPIWGISIAYAVEGKIQFGLCYCPEMNMLFEAKKGGGAWLNAERITCSNIDKLTESAITSGITHGTERAKGLNDPRLQLFWELVKTSQRVRILGSAVVQICEVASGHTEAFCGINLKPWDIAASILIVREAGGKATDFNGAEADLTTRNLITTNSKIHSELMPLCSRL